MGPPSMSEPHHRSWHGASVAGFMPGARGARHHLDPLRRVRCRSARSPSRGMSLARVGRMPAAETAIPSKTILLVEDDPSLRVATTTFLEDEGFCVMPASTGADALLILMHIDTPDLIVLDLVLPLMSGWDVSAE